MKCLWLIAGFTLLAPALHAMDCSGDRHFDPKSIFHVVTTPVQVRYFHNYTTAQIEGMRDLHFPNHLMHNPGLTLAEHEMKVDYQIGGLEHPDHDGFCVWVDSVNVNFSYKQMDVYITSQYPKGSCPYQTILNHENTHVAINQRALAKYRVILEKVLKRSRGIPTKAHPLSVVSMDNGKAIINSRIDAIVNRVTSAYKREVERNNGKIDTPASYKRTQAKCNNW